MSAVVIIYLDFTKTFNAVNHCLLLTMLKCHGTASFVISWVESPLRRRSFQVSANDSLSQMAKAASRVTQGSVLGPIPFVIYANDVADNLRINDLIYVVGAKVISTR